MNRINTNRPFLARFSQLLCTIVACSGLIGPGNVLLLAQTSPPDPAAASATQFAKIPAEQLDALVAPIALYPDPLLSQTLVASTYPVELMQLHQWLVKNPGLKDQALVDQVSKQPWDPSIQAMAPLADTVKWLADDIQWTTDLGNAFLAQQTDVMDAIQRMRAKAKEKGTLASGEQIKVETQTIEDESVIVIEQSNPQVIYVPSYDPMYAYGSIGYPYPPLYYPPYGGAIAAGVIAFGVGLALGAAWGGGWGWRAGWGRGDINVNRNNNFNRNANINGGNSGKWKHDAGHRGGAPYGRNMGGSNRGGVGGAGGVGGVGGAGGVGGPGGVGNRGNAGVSDRSRNGSGSNGGLSGGSSSNRMGDRNVGPASSNRSSGGFSGGSGGYSGSSARSSSSRGSYSMGGGYRGGFSGGGMRRGGGGRRR